MWFERATLSRHTEGPEVPRSSRDRRSRSLTKGASRLSNDMGAARLPLNRPRCGRRVGAVLRPAYRSRAVDCPADLLAGGRLVRPRLQGARPSGLAPQVPVYSWHLPTPTCARTAVPYGMGRKRLSLAGLPSFATRFLPGLLARSARSLRPGAPRYHALNIAPVTILSGSGTNPYWRPMSRSVGPNTSNSGLL